MIDNETAKRWKAGEIHQLKNILGDNPEISEKTFVEFIDCGLDYDCPNFVQGDESEFEKHHRELVEYAQNR